MNTKVREILGFIRDVKNIRYSLLLVLAGLILGIFAWDWTHSGQLMRLAQLPASHILILAGYLIGGIILVSFTWLLYSLILSYITDSDVHDILRNDSLSYLPTFVLMTFPFKYLFNMPAEYTQMRLVSAILVTLSLSGLVALKILFIRSDLRATSNRYYLSSRWSYVILIAFMVCYMTVFGVLVSLKYDAHNLALDTLGHMSQVAWGTLHGGRTVVSRWWVHVDPITAIFSPFYLIFSDARVLLWGQTVLLALGVLPVYWLARDLLKSNLAGLLFGLAYLLYPSVQYINLMDFCPEQLTVPFFLFAFYFIFKRRYILTSIFLLLAMMCKEYISLIVFFVGLFVILKQKDRKIGLGISAVALLWSYIALLVIIPHYSKELSSSLFYLSRRSDLGNPSYRLYSHLGNGFFGVIKGVLLNPLYTVRLVLMPEKVGSMMLLLLPVGFLSLLYPQVLGLAISTFAIILLTQFGTYRIEQHYVSSIIPFVFISAIYASRYLPAKLQNFCSRSESPVGCDFPQNALYSVVSFVFLCSILSNYFYSPSPVSRLYLPKTYQVTKRDKDINRMLKQTIPKRASVVAPNNIGAHLAQRPEIYRFAGYYPGYKGDSPPEPEFMLIDLFAPSQHYSGTYMSFDERIKLMRKLIHGDKYNLAAYQEGFAILQKGHARDEELDKIALSDLPHLLELPDVDFEGRIILLNYEIGNQTTASGKQIQLTCYWQVLDRFLTKEQLELKLEIVDGDGNSLLSEELPFATQEWEKWMLFKEKYSVITTDAGNSYRLAIGVTVKPGKRLKIANSHQVMLSDGLLVLHEDTGE